MNFSNFSARMDSTAHLLASAASVLLWHIKRTGFKAKIRSFFRSLSRQVRIARMALSMAITDTPTSANDAIHMP